MAKGTTKNQAAATKAVQTPADTAEPKKTVAAKKEAAKDQFIEADQAVLRGLPQGISEEAHQNIVRKSALGY